MDYRRKERVNEERVDYDASSIILVVLYRLIKLIKYNMYVISNRARAFKCRELSRGPVNILVIIVYKSKCCAYLSLIYIII